MGDPLQALFAEYEENGGGSYNPQYVATIRIATRVAENGGRLTDSRSAMRSQGQVPGAVHCVDFQGIHVAERGGGT